jgi:hypothetical protein
MKYVAMLAILIGYASAHGEDVLVTNSPGIRIAASVGVKGQVDFDPKRDFEIVITPTIVPDGGDHVLIPGDIRSAVDELLTALPKSYLSSIKPSVKRDPDGTPFLKCESPSPRLDELVRDWMVAYWNLDRVDSPLTSFYRTHISPGVFAEPIVEATLNYLCEYVTANNDAASP